MEIAWEQSDLERSSICFVDGTQSLLCTTLSNAETGTAEEFHHYGLSGCYAHFTCACLN
jgi:hypothetical protein